MEGMMMAITSSGLSSSAIFLACSLFLGILFSAQRSFADVIFRETDVFATAMQKCGSVYCGNTTTFIMHKSDCANPTIDISYRFTDFKDPDTQYFTVTVNEKRMGFCRGRSDGEVGTFYSCVKDLSLFEMVGASPEFITVELHLSPNVINFPFDNNLLVASTTIRCADTLPISAVVQAWDIASTPVISNQIACITAGCDATITYDLTQSPSVANGQCRLPLLSLAFWITDFDKSYEYMVIEVNGNYLGVCEGGAQDNYTNIFTCFEDVDVSRYTDEYPSQVVIHALIQDTVDRGWLDDGQSPYLLDANVSLSCSDSTQDDILPLVREWSPDASIVDVEDELVVNCQEVECGGLFTWRVNGQCLSPYLSFVYYSEHYDDSMVEILINDEIFGHCGPLELSDTQLTFETTDGTKTRVCFKQLSILEMLSLTDGNNNGNDEQWLSSMDSSGEFEFGFALTAVDILDGIRNGLVAKLVFRIGCNPIQHVQNVRESTLDLSVGRVASAQFGCVHSECSAHTNFMLQIPAQYRSTPYDACPLPVLDLSFYLTDFKLQTEYLSVSINRHLYGLCDGGGDDVLDAPYQCLFKADISSAVDLYADTNILLQLNVSSHVDGLDSANTYKQLLTATAVLSCLDATQDKKLVSGALNVEHATLTHESLKLPFECQGIGCAAVVQFNVQGVCSKPTLAVSFWLSDFLSFEKFVDVSINGKDVERCYGGGDRSFAAIYPCFDKKDITLFLDNYEYNEHQDFSSYTITDDTLNVTLQMSNASQWLDHGYNHSILEGFVSLDCRTEIEIDGDSDGNVDTEDGFPVDGNATNYQFVHVSLNIQRVSEATMRAHSPEIRERFEYALKIIIHVFNEGSDTISFSLQSDIEVIHVSELSTLHVYVVAGSTADAVALRNAIQLPIFGHYLQETLRDSNFANSFIANIHSVRLLTELPRTESPSAAPTSSPVIPTTLQPTAELTTTEYVFLEPKIASTQSLLQLFFTGAQAGDVLAFVAVLLILVLVCLSCVSAVTFFAVRHARKRTRKDISEYQQQRIEVGEMSITQDEDAMETTMFGRRSDDEDESISLGTHAHTQSGSTAASHQTDAKKRRNSSYSVQSLNSYSPLRLDSSSNRAVAKKLRRNSKARNMRAKVRRASTTAAVMNRKNHLRQKRNGPRRSSHNSVMSVSSGGRSRSSGGNTLGFGPGSNSVLIYPQINPPPQQQPQQQLQNNHHHLMHPAQMPPNNNLHPALIQMSGLNNNAGGGGMNHNMNHSMNVSMMNGHRGPMPMHAQQMQNQNQNQQSTAAAVHPALSDTVKDVNNQISYMGGGIQMYHSTGNRNSITHNNNSHSNNGGNRNGNHNNNNAPAPAPAVAAVDTRSVLSKKTKSSLMAHPIAEEENLSDQESLISDLGGQIKPFLDDTKDEFSISLKTEDSKISPLREDKEVISSNHIIDLKQLPTASTRNATNLENNNNSDDDQAGSSVSSVSDLSNKEREPSNASVSMLI